MANKDQKQSKGITAAQMGRIGGAIVLKKYGKDHYKSMGIKSGQSKRAKIKALKQELVFYAYLRGKNNRGSY